MLLKQTADKTWVEQSAITLIANLETIDIADNTIAEYYIWNSKKVQEFIKLFTSTDSKIEKALLTGEYRKYFNVSESDRSTWIMPKEKREVMKKQLKYKILNNDWGN